MPAQNKMMNDELTRSLRWKCRRGLLELDVLLERFLEDGYFSLTKQQQQTFSQFLDEPDQVLLDWLLGHSEPQDDTYKTMVRLILEGSRKF